MVTLSLIGMVIFTSLLLYMSLKCGTQKSISALAGNFRWVLLLALWSQILLAPQLFTMTPENWKWLVFFGMAGIITCGGANVLDKTDELVHIISAIVSFVCLFVLVILINPICLVPLALCLAGGKENLKWRSEIGLISSVYLMLLL